MQDPFEQGKARDRHTAAAFLEPIPSHDRKKDPDGEHHTRQEPRRCPGDRTVADLAPVLPAVLDQDLVSL